MSEDKIFALITVIASGIFGLLVSILTTFLQARREDRIFKRQLYKERIETTRNLYQDTLSILAGYCKRGGVGTEEDQNELIHLRSRLALSADRSVQTCFQKSSESLEIWAAEYQKAQPRQMGSYILIESGRKYSEHEVEAEKLFPNYEQEFQRLQEAMSKHLRNLEEEM